MKKGYITAEIDTGDTQKIVNWSCKYIPRSCLVTAEVNGKVEGGDVSEDAHLTIFFGVDDEKVDKKDLNDYIGKINLKKLKISGVSSFNLPEWKAKVVFLVVDDSNENIRSINQTLTKLPNLKEYVKPFIPHISIAYVRNDFDEKVLISDTLSELKVSEIKYKVLN